MKKFLLSALAVATCTGFAMAENETVTLDVATADNIQGTFNEEVLKDDGTLQSAPNYSPLESLEIDNYAFEFATGEGSSAPALYLTPSTNANTKPTIRVYTSNTMTITAPEGLVMSKIVFAGSNGTANAAHTASVGTVSDVTASAMTWSYGEGTNSVTFTFAAKARFTSMTVTLGESDDPVVTEPSGVDYVLASEVVSGSKYILFADGANKVATALTSNYGYLQVVDATVENNTITTSEDYGFTFTADGEGFNIQDKDGYYYYQTGSYNSFNRSLTKPESGAVWTVAIDDDGFATITNTGVSKFISYSTTYTSFGSYASLSDANVLPMLFVADATSGIEAVATDNTNAPVVYFNLQGQRVANPAQGIFIRVQGNKVEKVAIR